MNLNDLLFNPRAVRDYGKRYPDSIWRQHHSQRDAAGDRNWIYPPDIGDREITEVGSGGFRNISGDAKDIPGIGPWELFQARSPGDDAEHGPWELFGEPPVAPGRKDSSVGSKFFAAMRGAADTATFGLNDRLMALAGAGLGAARGDGFDYAGNLERQRAITRGARETNPYSFLAGQLTGGLAVPGGAGAGGATLAARAGRGFGAGATQGGLYGLGSSEDFTNLPDVAKNTATGMAIGGAIGGVASPLVEGLGTAARRVAGSVRGIVNPEREATRRVAGALAEDTRLGGGVLDQTAFREAQGAGQPVVIGDLGRTTTQSLARSAADTSPAARAALEDVVQPRFEDQSQRIAAFLGGLGAGNTTKTLENLQAAGRAANAPLYKKAFAEGESGIWNEGLSNLMDAPAVQDAVRGAIKTGANRSVAEGFRPVKSPFSIGPDGMLAPKINPDGTQAVPSLQFWDGVKRNLDDRIGSLLRAGEKSAAMDATELRSQLVGYLDRASPSYATARETAAKFLRARKNALETGKNFVAASGSNDSFRPAIAKMSTWERELFAHSFASELTENVLRVADSTDAVRRLASPRMRERIAMALGPGKADQFMGFLAVESAMNVLKRAVQGNSTTSRQLAELGLAGGSLGIDMLSSGRPGNLTAGVIGMIALRRGAAAGAGRINRSVSEHVGKLLASDSPAAMKKLAGIASKSNKVRDLLLSITPKAVSAIIPPVAGAAVQ